MIPNRRALQGGMREHGIEVVYTTIEAYTRDGRDISLDHEISGLFFPKGSWEARVIDEVGPVGDEIVIPKRRERSVRAMDGHYARVRSTAALLEKLAALETA